MFELSLKKLENGENGRNSRADNLVSVDRIRSYFNFELYYLETFLFPKFETDQIIFVRVIVATPRKLEKLKKFKGR